MRVFLSHSRSQRLLPYNLFILDRKVFMGPRENAWAPYKSFLSLPPNQTTHKFIFSHIFSPKFSILPISPPNKHTLKKWKAMAEIEIDLKVKCLRLDNRREYIDGGFNEYCATHGIRMEKIILGTPQLNGVAECMNRTLNECAKSMWLHTRLPKTFWIEAVNTAAYLIN